MFAPYCPSCRSRVLLGPRRIVHFAWSGRSRPAFVLRCYCGTLVDWDRQPPPTDDTSGAADYLDTTCGRTAWTS